MVKKFTIADLYDFKQQRKKLAMVSCYDYTTARQVAQTSAQSILVGDSAAQFILGHESTLPAKMDFMVTITEAVRRAAPKLFLVADMPFLSYQTGRRDALINAGRFITEAGADMIKIEASAPYLDVIKAVSDAGMPVMAHIGIKPQMIAKMGRFKAEGTTAEMAAQLLTLAENMVAAGAGSILLEGTAAEVSEIITEKIDIPVIGCGSGPACDGQVLIAPDILGQTEDKGPKFAKNFARLGPQAVKAFDDFARQVMDGQYPDHDHSYHMKNGELQKFQDILQQRY